MLLMRVIDIFCHRYHSLCLTLKWCLVLLAPSLNKTGGMPCSTEASLFSASSLSSFCSGTRSSPVWVDKNKEQTRVFVCKWWALAWVYYYAEALSIMWKYVADMDQRSIDIEWLFWHSCTPQVYAVYAEVILLRKSSTLHIKPSSDKLFCEFYQPWQSY